MTAATSTASFPRNSSALPSSTYLHVYGPSENSHQNNRSMSADVQHEYSFDIGFAMGSTTSFADLKISQRAFSARSVTMHQRSLAFEQGKSVFI